VNTVVNLGVSQIFLHKATCPPTGMSRNIIADNLNTRLSRFAGFVVTADYFYW
jgi:hypothetical protein